LTFEDMAKSEFKFFFEESQTSFDYISRLVFDWMVYDMCGMD
jgi:hypothetical protein